MLRQSSQSYNLLRPNKWTHIITNDKPLELNPGARVSQDDPLIGISLLKNYLNPDIYAIRKSIFFGRYNLIWVWSKLGDDLMGIDLIFLHDAITKTNIIIVNDYDINNDRLSVYLDRIHGTVIIDYDYIAGQYYHKRTIVKNKYCDYQLSPFIFNDSDVVTVGKAIHIYKNE